MNHQIITEEGWILTNIDITLSRFASNPRIFIDDLDLNINLIQNDVGKHDDSRQE